jgi:hypothetical protein
MDCWGDKDLQFDLKYKNESSSNALPMFREEYDKVTGKRRIHIDQNDVKEELRVTCKDSRNSHSWTIDKKGNQSREHVQPQ